MEKLTAEVLSHFTTIKMQHEECLNERTFSLDPRNEFSIEDDSKVLSDCGIVFDIPVHFDVDKVFGINVCTSANDDYVNIYAKWKLNGNVELTMYFANNSAPENGDFELAVDMNAQQQELVNGLVLTACKDVYGKTPEEIWGSYHKEAEDVFMDELALISDASIRNAVKEYFDKAVPDYFWTIPASSGGKYHPSFDQHTGGLVRHTQMNVAIANQLVGNEQYAGINKDVIVASLLIHDSCKNGKHENRGFTHPHHPRFAAENFRDFIEASHIPMDHDALLAIFACTLSHMGQWSCSKLKEEMRKYEDVAPREQDLVHLADYIGSRKFFDKFGE